MYLSNKRATTKYSIVEKQRDEVLWISVRLNNQVYQINRGYVSRVDDKYGTIYFKRYDSKYIEHDEDIKDLGRTWFYACKVYESMLKLAYNVEIV